MKRSLSLVTAFALLLAAGLLPSAVAAAQSEENKTPKPMSSQTFMGLTLRSVGPAVTSGRVVGFAVDPANRARYYVASASGGVWKTENNGATFAPIFDREGSYSIGVIVLDPRNPSVVWVGAGENNSQRSVSYGDGVYKSEDGGKTWKNLGLKNSQHIGRIAIDPGNTDTVYVAAQGPLWSSGGDRGLFKTTDGGKTWKNILSISENTGVTDVVLDPRDSNVMYAASYQRARKVYTLIDGGPESAIYRSTDAGATWTKLKTGLPTVDMGRIGITVSPVNPDVLYATIEAAERKGGIFCSTDRGATWERRNPFNTGAMYYAQITADPNNVDRIYIMNVFIQVSDDGGRTVHSLGEPNKHVDNHVIWIDPNDTDYYLVGCDGGVYESYDRAKNWTFKANLPVTQFYDVDVDNAKPFYFVYGGTQDNYSLGGPSRTKSISGITNADWFVTQGGDGFRSVADPEDPNIIYAELQYGELIRFDRRNGERMDIKPQEGKGEAPMRWNWDSPIIISPHSHTRLYFASNKLFRSDDRGNTWKSISPDLSRQIDPNTLPIMGRIWRPEAVAKGESTSFYGNSTTIAESPLKEGLLYVGTDDGLIQVSENAGGAWRKIEKFPGVPEMTYVTRIKPSAHNGDTVYAAFDNHKNGDFAPYVLKSTDRGQNWTSIKGDLPANGPVLALAEDPVDPNLLFAGTEFGLFFTNNGGQNWIQLKGGMPIISVRDLAIQKREGDLVVATFGRGIYILDDYSPLRNLKPETLQQNAALFPVHDALMYIQERPLGGTGKSFQGASFYIAPNPSFGASFTYYLKNQLRTRKETRQQLEQAADRPAQKPKSDNAAQNKDADEDKPKVQTPVPYPATEQLRAEADEAAPKVILTITDSSGQVVRRIEGPVTRGVHRVSWDLRFPASVLAAPRGAAGGEEQEEELFGERPAGSLVMPGKYSVSIAQEVDGKVTQLGGPQSFSVTVDGVSEMSDSDRAALVGFQRKVARLQRAVIGAQRAAEEVRLRLTQIHRAVDETPVAGDALREEASAIEKEDKEILRQLEGDPVLRAHNQNAPVSISQRVGSIVSGQRMSTSRPTQTQTDAYTIAADEFTQILSRLHRLVEVDLVKLQKEMQNAGSPWVPGIVPDWKEQ